jgi:membrane protease YdiL (CAAX protease family)
MSEPANDPPLVTRPPEPPAAPAVAPAAPKRPRPGFWEAALWCGVFVGLQLCTMLAVVVVVFCAYAFASPQPGAFFDQQTDGFIKAVDPNFQGERPPLPFEFGQAIAYGMLAAQFTSLGLIALVLPRRVGPEWKRQLGFRTPAGLHVLLVVLLVPGFMIVSGVVQEAFLWATGIRPPAAMKSLNGVFGRFPLPLTVLAVSIGPGVVEELWCRAFLGRGLSARYGLLWGVALTSAFFALMHIDPSQLLVIALMGAYLHFVYVATRSIWTPILLHALNNGVSILLVLALKPEQMDQDKNVPIVVTLAAVSLMIFATVALWTGRAAVFPGTGGSTAWTPEYPGVSAPPPDADARLGYEAVSPVAVMFTALSFAAVMWLGYKYLI